jgi:hypothetical protein
MSNQTVLSAIDLALALMTRAAQISTLVAQAQADGRTQLTTQEWEAINADDDAERQRLVDEIAKAKGGGT